MVSPPQLRAGVPPRSFVSRAAPFAARPFPRATSSSGCRTRLPRPATCAGVPRSRPTGWDGVRDATQFAPSCPQPASPFAPPTPFSEDCLYLNVYTPTLRRGADRPVLVWIHGGGFTEDGARNYDGSKLAADGTVVVTINYRLGALGFLAHPALARRPGGPTGNYGLMDQIAALRWVRRNIARFGGDPHNVTIAGQSAGGVSVLDLLVSRRSRGLFQRAIVQSGAFALTQQPLADAEAAGEAFAAEAGCPDQTAQCLRHLPVDALVNNFPGAAIPGVIDGKVLTESIGTALAAGRFAHVPILNGINHIEELIFVAGLHVAVSGGTFVPIPREPVTPDSYQPDIAAVLGVSSERAAAIAAEYPLDAYPSPDVALSTLVSDANFACPALQVDRWTSERVPTFAYQFNDDNAPERFAAATTGSDALIRAPIHLRPTQRTDPRHAQRRPADTRLQHARGVDELRRHRRSIDASDGLAGVQSRRAGDVARPAAPAGLAGLRRRAPLLLLGSRIGRPH